MLHTTNGLIAPSGGTITLLICLILSGNGATRPGTCSLRPIICNALINTKDADINIYAADGRSRYADGRC